jgi:intracellular sulfur oxidation DsrE/DsrF family protein
MNPRRSFLSRLGISAAALGFGDARLGAQDAAAPGANWSPDRHTQDDWLDKIPGRHRFFLDTLSEHGAGDAAAFVNNYYAANKSAYQLGEADLAVVICLRHLATPYAFNDTIWGKYGPTLADLSKYNGDKVDVNPHRTAFDKLAARGTHFAVCDMATHYFARNVAVKAALDADAVYKEMVANAVANSHFVAAGIVAVQRSQERGYSIGYVG